MLVQRQHWGQRDGLTVFGRKAVPGLLRGPATGLPNAVKVGQSTSALVMQSEIERLSDIEPLTSNRALRVQREPWPLLEQEHCTCLCGRKGQLNE